jgi:2-(1,2-epoxy-1,2-dihydrophenyl)acetyl-CoA isomerase
MADGGPVTTSVVDGVAQLRLASPETGNAFGPALAAELRRGAESLGRRRDLRVVVLSAEGRAFCVGGDLRYFADSAEHAYGAVHDLVDQLNGALSALVELEAPVVAKVDGVAAGAGMSLVCAADLAVASERASFTMAYTAVGLSPDGSATWFLPRLVGWRRAGELMLTNRRLSAAEALDLGILTEVVSVEDLDHRVDELVASLAAGPTSAYGAVKRLLRLSATSALAPQLEAEADSIATLAASPSGREGVEAFLAKRPPAFPPPA